MASTTSTHNDTEKTQDVSAILLSGIGAPYVAIFDGSSNPILDPVNNLPIGTFIDNFIYEYNEEKEDSGSFVITTNNPEVCDLPQLQYQEILWVQWGYSLPNGQVICGSPRRVMVTDISASFRDSGITIELKFADSSILLKTMPSNYYSKEYNWLKDLGNVLSGNVVSTTIKVYETSPSDDYYLVVNQSNDYTTEAQQNARRSSKEVTVIMEEEDGYKGDIIYQSGTNPNRNSYSSAIQPAYEVLPEAVPVKAIPITREEAFSEAIDSLLENHPEKFKRVPSRELLGQPYNSIIITGSTPNNVWGQIANIGKVLPNGPYYMDGRDGQLVLHNQVIHRPVSIKYTWMGGSGELLDFNVNSKFIRSLVEISSGADIDPDSKELRSTVVQGINDKSMVNPDIYLVGSWSNPKPTVPENPTVSGIYSLESLKKVADGYGIYTRNLSLIPKVDSTEPDIIVDRFQTTEEERKQWAKENFSLWEKTVNKKVQTQQELEEAIHEGYYLKSYKAKRVKVYRFLAIDENSARRQAKKILGDYEIVQIEKGEFVRKEWSNTAEGLGDTPGNRYGDHYYYYVAYNSEASIDGIRVVNDITDWTDLLQANDIQENISNQIKASATVLGRPSIESSMNIEIDGVAKFSGIWYTKVVKHRITTSSGYTTEIDFVQRNSSVSRVVVSKSQALSNISKDLNEAAKKSIQDGLYEHASPKYIEKVLKDLGVFNYSSDSKKITISQDGTATVESTKDSFSGGVVNKDLTPFKP